MEKEICFGCGKEGYFIYGSPMRCSECIKNKVPIDMAQVKNCYLKMQQNEEEL